LAGAGWRFKAPRDLFGNSCFLKAITSPKRIAEMEIRKRKKPEAPKYPKYSRTRSCGRCGIVDAAVCLKAKYSLYSRVFIEN